MSLLHDAFARAKSENRAALIAYLPAGYPTEDGAVECITAMVEGGVDIVEIGFPYSDPVMDGPTIQAAAVRRTIRRTIRRRILANNHLSTVLRFALGAHSNPRRACDTNLR